MSNNEILNVHDIIKKYSLPISHKNQSIRECLKSFLRSYYLDLKKLSDGNYPDDFPTEFYKNLKEKYLPIIKIECIMLFDILNEDGKCNEFTQVEKFDSLMWLLDNVGVFRIQRFKKLSRFARIRSGIENYNREGLFHIPYSSRNNASSCRFSSPHSPCLYLSFHRGLRVNDEEMVNSAWIECGMPIKFTYCIYELQKDLNVLHLGKDGNYYINTYDNAKSDTEREERTEALAQYLLTFPLRAACHISVEEKSKKSETEEYFFPQLLMQWLQNNSKFDGVSYQGASSNFAQRDLYIGNLALPARNLSDANQYDSHLKECFKLSEPIKKDLFAEFNSNAIAEKVKNFESYLKELQNFLSKQNVPQEHPYTMLFSYCKKLQQIYPKMINGDKCSGYEEFASIHKKFQMLYIKMINCKTVEEWLSKYDNSRPITESDFDNIIIPFQNIAMSLCHEVDTIFSQRNCRTFLKNFDFQYITKPMEINCNKKETGETND